MLWALRGHRRPSAMLSRIRRSDVRHSFLLPRWASPSGLVSCSRVPRSGTSRMDSVKRIGMVLSASHISDISVMVSKAEGSPKLPTRACRCSIVVSIPACYAVEPRSDRGNGAPLCFAPRMVVDGPARCSRVFPGGTIPFRFFSNVEHHLPD